MLNIEKLSPDCEERQMAIHLTLLGKTDAWALWLYDSCVWSEGA